MIIPEQSVQKPLLKPQVTSDTPEAVTAPPPPYGTYVHEVPRHPPPSPPISTGPTARRRFFRALLVALVIWFLFTALVHSIVIVVHSSRHKPHHHSPQEPLPNLPPPPGMSFNWCRSWTYTSGPDRHTTPPYASIASFDLPTSADALFVLSASRHIGGSLQVRPASDPHATDVHVDVEVGYYLEEVRDKAHVCLLKRAENEHGVGIFTDESWPPRRRSREDQLTFKITVSVPSTSLNSFETDLPNFSQDADFSHIYLNNLSLESTNGPITASAMVNNASVVSTNGPIKGEITVEHKLRLHTTNARIEIAAHLVNDVEQHRNTTLDAKTTNGQITANLFLDLADHEHHQAGGNFEVSAHTTNSPIQATVRDAPVDSALWLSAATTNSAAGVVAHPTYQGTFEIGTTLFRPNVHVTSTSNDPSHRGRTRMLDIRRSGYVVQGSTYWSDGRSAPEVKGSIQLRSTNSPVQFTVL